jgi:hypothetical protein
MLGNLKLKIKIQVFVFYFDLKMVFDIGILFTMMKRLLWSY